MKKIIIATSILLCSTQLSYGIFGRKTTPFTASKELIEKVRTRFNAQNKTIVLEKITNTISTMPSLQQNQMLLQIRIDRNTQQTTTGDELFVIVNENGQFVSFAKQYNENLLGSVPKPDLKGIELQGTSKNWN